MEKLKEPVKLPNGEKRWLMISKPEKTKGGIIKPQIEIQKEGLWQCEKCGNTVQSNPGEPTQCYENQGGCGRASTFKIINDVIVEGVWKIPTWDKIDLEVEIFELYKKIYDITKEIVIFPEEIHYKIITLWIISTWKIENWETVCFPVFRGIIGSGKTRALNLIQELAYRCVPSAMISFSALARLSHHWHVTITIDEANARLDKKYEAGSQLLDFIKQSYKRGSKYIRADTNDDKKVIPTDNFGFKAFAGEKSFDTALVSRGLDVFMEKDEPIVKKIEDACDELEKLRTLLLHYRIGTGDPPELEQEYILKGRTREIYECIIRVAKQLGQSTEDIEKFALRREKEEEEALQGTVQYEILKFIKDRQENQTLDDSPEIISLDDIVAGIGWGGEKRANQKVGYILKNIGLTSKHGREGKILALTDGQNSRRLGYLYKRYNVS